MSWYCRHGSDRFAFSTERGTSSVVVAPRPMKMATTRSPWPYLLSAERAVLIWSMHSDQSSSITSVSASLSALRNVTSADTDEAGHLFQPEAGQRSDLKPACKASCK